MQRTVNLRLVIKPESELGYNFLKSDLGGGWPSKGTCLRVWACDGRRELTLSNSVRLRHRDHDTLGLCKHVINNCQKKLREKRKEQCYLGVKACFIIKFVKTQEHQTTVQPIVNPSHLKLSNTVGKTIISFCSKEQTHFFGASLFQRILGEKFQQLMLRGVSYLSAIEHNFDTLQTEF